MAFAVVWPFFLKFYMWNNYAKHFSLKNYNNFPNHAECDNTYLEYKPYSELRRQPQFISTHLNTFCVHIDRLQYL